MGQDDPLGGSGGPRGVHDNRGVRGGRGRGPHFRVVSPVVHHSPEGHYFNTLLKIRSWCLKIKDYF